MKIIKPLRMTIMPRPYRWRGGIYLAVSVAVLVRHDAHGPKVQAEHFLVHDVLPELDADEMMDMVMPKPHPEFLVSGYAYTAHQKDKQKCMVSARVGCKRKDGLVFGDRYWLGNRISEPAPFEAMPLTWANSFGGRAIPDNPVGTGLDEVEVNGARAIRLPNLECPTERIQTRGQIVQPYNFGLIRPDWPSRLEKLGSCDEEWVNTVGSGFFDDLQFSAFNAASDDQIWHDRDALSMDEPFEFWNMHPELHCWQGTLPSLHARCFIQRSGAQQLDEISMRPTTAWFLPHRTSYILLFHGQTPIAEDDAFDISGIMGALEHAGQPRPEAHYMSIYARRTSFDSAALDAFRDGDLMPSDILAPWLEDIPLGDRPLMSKLADRLQRDTGAYPPGGFVGPVKPLTLDRLADVADEHEKLHEDTVARLQQERREALAKAESEIRQSSFSKKEPLLEAVAGMESSEGGLTLPEQGPPDLTAIFDSVRKAQSRHALRASLSDSATTDMSPRDLYQHSKRGLKQLYLYSVHFQRGVARAAPHRALQIRDQVLRKYRANKKLSDMDLTGADLSGMDLSGADFSRTWLEKADFTGANLSGAKFHETVLARASFVDCRLDGAWIEHSNIGEAEFINVSFGNATLTRLICEVRTRFQNCSFEAGAIDDFVMHHAEFKHCAFRQMKLESLSFEGGSLQDVAIAEASMNKVGFDSVHIDNLHIDESILHSCSASETRFQNLRLTGSILSKCVFSDDVSFTGCWFNGGEFHQTMFRLDQFENVLFESCRLEQCDFSQASFINCRFDKVSAPQSIFVRAQLDLVDMSGCNLMQANFQKASLVGANLSRCNFFRADMSETLLDASTRVDGAYVHRTRLAPYRQSGGPVLEGSA